MARQQVMTPPERHVTRRRARVAGPARTAARGSFTQFEMRLCSGDPNCTPIAHRDNGTAVHREGVDDPEILVSGSVGVVTTIPVDPYDVSDIGEDQTSVRVAVMLARSG